MAGVALAHHAPVTTKAEGDVAGEGDAVQAARLAVVVALRMLAEGTRVDEGDVGVGFTFLVGVSRS
jgi:hypothetical protein